MTFYHLLVFIHIFSAILGLGPGFIMTFLLIQSKTLAELKFGFKLRKVLHTTVMSGGILLLVTGLLMGTLHPYLFTAGWYVTSLILYFIALAIGPFVLAPITRPIKALLANCEGDAIPDDYYLLAKRLYFYEHLINAIFVVIIVLMVWKPF